MATTPAPVAEPQAKISPLGRVFGVLFSPKPTFEDIVRKPSWVAPVIALMLTGILLNVALAVHTNWNEVSRQQIEKSKFAAAQIDKLPEAQKEQAYERAAKQGKIMRYVRAMIGWPLLLLFATAIYFGAFRLIGGARVSFSMAFVLMAFAHIPMGLKEILGAMVTMLRDPGAIDPENYLASNPAALLGPDTPAWQTVPLAFLDIFGIWALILVAVAFSVADPKKVPFGKSVGIVIGITLCFMAFFTGLAWIFS
jgi:Yip1-like protein